MYYFKLWTNSTGFWNASIEGYDDYLVNCDAIPICHAKPDEHLIVKFTHYQLSLYSSVDTAYFPVIIFLQTFLHATVVTCFIDSNKKL